MDPSLTLAELTYTKTTLANGLDVVVRRQGSLPVVGVNLWYHVGSKDDRPGGRGFAHLFEHLMFEGSRHYPGDFFKPLQRVGAGVNGSTSADRTNYYIDAPTAHLDLALAMESDRMGFLLPALSDEKLDIQKGVVTNEYRQNYANRPYGLVGVRLAEALYPPEHPYHWLTIGVMEDVARAERPDIEAFFQRYYVPANASLSLVGDLDEDDALGRAERYFGPIPGGSRAAPLDPGPARLDRPVAIRMHDRVELERVYASWHTVPQFHPDDAPLAMLGDVLGRGRASRLYRKLVEPGIAQNLAVHQSGRELAGTFGAIVTLRPGRARSEVREVLLAEIAAIVRDGPEPDELERARNGRVAGFVYALDNVGGFGGVADRLNAYNVYLGDPGRVVSDLRRFQEVNAADLARVAGAYLAGRPGVLLDVLREAPGAAVQIDRSVAPPAAPAVAYRAPVPVVLDLECGSPLWVIPQRDLPIVAATAVVRAGAREQPPGAAGLANLVSATLDEGTRDHSARELAEAVEGAGAHLSTDCGYDGSYISTLALRPHFNRVLGLAAEVLRHPTFPQEEFTRIRGQVLASLQSERDRAEARAQRALLRAIFASDHPYATPVEGDFEAVATLDRPALAAFHAERFRPGGTAWVVAGDVEPEAVRDQLDALLAGWAGGGEADQTQAAGRRRPERPRLLMLHRPGATQAVVRAGHVGIGRLDPDYHALSLFNHVLGGLFTSRLNEELREKRGLTYGIRSHVEARREPGPFWIGASLQADRLAEALDALRGEVEAILDHRPPTDPEIDDARRSLIEGQARHFEGPAALVSRFGGLNLVGLPPDEHRATPQRLAALTRAEIITAGARRIEPRALTYVVVADAEEVGPQLGRLGWADVERIDDGPGSSFLG